MLATLEQQSNLGFQRRSELTPRQLEGLRLLTGPQQYTLLRGGSRSGKTFLIIRALCYRAMAAPNSRHAVLRFRANAARSALWLDTIPKVLRTCFPPGFAALVKQHKADGYWEFPNGSQLWVGGLDEQARVDKILGMEFSSIFFNETTQIPYASVLVALTRLAQQCGIPLRAYFDCNPSGMTHYTYRLFKQFRDPESGRDVDPADYREMQMNPEDNRVNIAPGYIEKTLASLPDKQRRRFFLGEWSPEVEGALWSIEAIDKARVVTDGLSYDQLMADMHIPPLVRCVVAVDPSGAAGPEDKRSDEIGIVVAGLGTDGRGYVLADRTCKLGPSGWGGIAATAYSEYRADLIVAEKNFGGEMVKFTLQVAAPMAPVKLVVASRGKAVRAEPISALYDPSQDLVRHVGYFPELEEQMLSFSAAGYEGARSPNRVDALVWALTELLVASGQGLTDFL